MTTLEVGNQFDQALEKLAKESGESKESLTRHLIQNWIEELEDTRLGLAILKQNNRRYSMEEMEREFGPQD